jgi:hypothetical protein
MSRLRPRRFELLTTPDDDKMRSGSTHRTSTGNYEDKNADTVYTGAVVEVVHTLEHDYIFVASPADDRKIRADYADILLMPFIFRAIPKGLPVTFQIWTDPAGGKFAFNVSAITS